MDWHDFSASADDVVGYFANTRQKKSKALRVTLDLPRPQPGERFLRGPIPMSWLKIASKCGNRSEAVAILLWYAAGWQKSNPVKLHPSILAEFQVHPKTARRVLSRMAELGIVRNEFHRGRSPLVTICAPREAIAE